MSAVGVGLISIAAIFVLLFAKMPVAYVMIVVGMTGYAILTSVPAALSVASSTMFSTFTDYSLTVIPLFVWMGFIAYYAGISRRVYDATHKVTGTVPGGLALATIGASTAFGAICGSTTATAATMGTVALPEMKRYDYDSSLAAATVAASAILGIMIPPSVIFILYGVSTGESIRELFLAGIIPGILLMLLFMGVTFLKAWRNPVLAPVGNKVALKQKITSVLLSGIEVIIIFILVMGGLFADIFTPTEAGAVGAFCTLLVALIRRQLDWKGFVNSLADAVSVSAMIMFLVAGATIFGRFLAITGLPSTMATWAVNLPLPTIAILAVILAIYLILGFFIDALALILLTVPIFYPVAMELGFDPVWFGVIITLVVGMGVITPPVGANVYVVAGVEKETPVMTIFKGIWPFLGSIIILLAILIAFPQIALFLPGLSS